ncbi:MAG: ATPase, partial [Candidatus Thermoplasmatota archaeon]
MAQKAIREADGKRMIARLLGEYTDGGYKIEDRFITITPETDLKKIPSEYKWVTKQKLVVKPDQLIKRRGKSKLILLDADWKTAEKWIKENMNKKITIGSVTGVLTHFIVEPFIPHKETDEYYVAILSKREGDEILFHHQGGINVGDIDTKASRLMVPIGEYPKAEEIQKKLLGGIPKE